MNRVVSAGVTFLVVYVAASWCAKHFELSFYAEIVAVSFAVGIAIYILIYFFWKGNADEP